MVSGFLTKFDWLGMVSISQWNCMIQDIKLDINFKLVTIPYEALYLPSSEYPEKELISSHTFLTFFWECNQNYEHRSTLDSEINVWWNIAKVLLDFLGINEFDLFSNLRWFITLHFEVSLWIFNMRNSSPHFKWDSIKYLWMCICINGLTL